VVFVFWTFSTSHVLSLRRSKWGIEARRWNSLDKWRDESIKSQSEFAELLCM